MNERSVQLVCGFFKILGAMDKVLAKEAVFSNEGKGVTHSISLVGFLNLYLLLLQFKHVYPLIILFIVMVGIHLSRKINETPCLVKIAFFYGETGEAMHCPDHMPPHLLVEDLLIILRF